MHPVILMAIDASIPGEHDLPGELLSQVDDVIDCGRADQTSHKDYGILFGHSVSLFALSVRGDLWSSL